MRAVHHKLKTCAGDHVPSTWEDGHTTFHSGAARPQRPGHYPTGPSGGITTASHQAEVRTIGDRSVKRNVFS